MEAPFIRFSYVYVYFLSSNPQRAIGSGVDQKGHNFSACFLRQ